MTIIFKHCSFKNTRKAKQAFLRIFSIEMFKCNRPLEPQMSQLFCARSLLWRGDRR